MGLLDFSGFVGDDTAKDEFGMTQADRRQPLFTGLLKAGMLGMAAGENITPGQRAQLMGQVGGAITDIPDAMNRNRAEAAQMQLRRQQFTTNQQKLEQQRKLQAYATSPEGQQALSSLSAPVQFAAKAALEAGDVDSFQRIITGASAEAHRQKMETLAERRVRLQEEKDDRKERETQENPFGNTYEGRMYNVLLRGKRDPKFAESDEYAAAWNHFNRDQRPVTIGNTTIVEPKLANIGDFPSPGAKPAPGSPTATETLTPPPPVEAGKTVQAPDGSTVWLDNPSKPNEVSIEHPSKPGEVRVVDRETGREIRVDRAQPIPETTKLKFAEQDGFRKGIEQAKNQFLAAWKTATPGERFKSIATKGTVLNSAWANLTLLAKGKDLYELGVLNEGDLPQLQKAIADPSNAVSTYFTSEAELEKMMSQMTDVMDARIKGTRESYMQSRRRAPAAGGGKRKIKEFRNGKLVEVEVD